MAYSTVADVRLLVGLPLTYVTGEKLRGTPDNSTKVFYVPFRYMSDYDADGDTDTSDVIVYDDGVAVTVSSIDVALNKVTLSAAPATSSVMTVDYAYSPVKDATITAIITRVDEQIERKTRTKGTSTSYTQYWDGDGENNIFYFSHKPVTAITTIVIDGTTVSYTEGTDYWLYPERTRALWIKFYDAPSSDYQNLAITYSYGESNAILSKLSLYMSAKELIQYHFGRATQSIPIYTGKDASPSTTVESKGISQMRAIDEEIKRLWEQLGYQNEVSVV